MQLASARAYGSDIGLSACSRPSVGASSTEKTASPVDVVHLDSLAPSQSMVIEGPRVGGKRSEEPRPGQRRAEDGGLVPLDVDAPAGGRRMCIGASDLGVQRQLAAAGRLASAAVFPFISPCTASRKKGGTRGRGTGPRGPMGIREPTISSAGVRATGHTGALGLLPPFG